jgi:hypothetical protein
MLNTYIYIYVYFTALVPLQTLPVWLVVRLSTDDEAIVKYWNKIEKKLTLEMDVLDDLFGEGLEVRTF